MPYAQFPNSSRVVYRSTPLRSVTCELRFPTILKIDVEPPASFQERIRHKLPMFARQDRANVAGIPPQILQVVESQLPGRSFSFGTPDTAYIARLSASSIGLTCSAYQRWEEYSDFFSYVLEAFSTEYAPSFITRTGLRYQNAILRSAHNLSASPWSDLLKAEIAGELALPGWDDAQEVRRVTRVALDDFGNCLRLEHGLATVGDEPETSYLLDFDFYNDNQTEVTNVVSTIEKLHEYSGHAFRWAISPRLDDAMGPEPV